jgi:hypothetical protein
MIPLSQAKIESKLFLLIGMRVQMSWRGDITAFPHWSSPKKAYK